MTLPRGLQQRGDSFVAYLTIDAQRVRRSIGRVSQKVAEQQLAIWQREIAEGRYVKPVQQSTATFAEIADEWTEQQKTDCPKSFEATECRVKRVKAHFSGRMAASIEAGELESYLNEGRTPTGGKWSAATHNHHRGVLAGIFKLAVRRKRVPGNPVNEAVPLKSLNNARDRFLSRDEAATLRAYILAHYPAHIADFDLALFSGMRKSEMYGRAEKHYRTAGLSWANVHFDKNYIEVRESKNGKPRRIRLNDKTVAALHSLAKRNPAPGPVFGSYLAKSLKWFTRSVDACGLDGIVFHSLRHTWASWLVMNGCDLLTLMHLGGWRSLRLVERYGHLSAAHLDVAASLICQTATETATGEKTQSQVYRN